MGFLGGSLAFLVGIVDMFEDGSDEPSIDELVENKESDDDKGGSGFVAEIVKGSVS